MENPSANHSEAPPVGAKPRSGTYNLPALLSGLVLAFSLFGDSLLYAVLPVYAADFGISLAFVGILLSVNRWVRLFSNPLAVWVYRGIGLHRAMLLACVATVLTTLVYAYPVSILLLLAARMLWGVCWSHLRLGSYLVVVHSARNNLGLSMGMMQAVSRLGSAFTLVAGSVLVDSLGYSKGLTAIAFLSAISIPVVYVLRGCLRRNSIAISVPVAKPKGSPVEKKGKGGGDGSALGGGISVYWCYAAGFVNSFANRGLVVASISYVLQKRIGAESHIFGMGVGIATLSGMVLASRWLCTFLFSPLVGHLSDRHGRRRILLLSFFMEAVALLAIGLVPLPLWTVVGAVGMFFAGSVTETVLSATVADIAGTGDVAAKMSVFATFDDMGAAAGPLLGYLVASMIGFSLTYVSGAIAVLCLLLFPLLARLARASGRPRSGPSRSIGANRP